VSDDSLLEWSESDAAKNSAGCYAVAIAALRERLEASRVVIGDCTLYCEDCEFILPTLVPNSIRMIWTDPPYGHNNHDGDLNARLNDFRHIEQRPIANDGPEDMRRVVDKMLLLALRVLKKDANCCCCCCGGGGGPRPTFAWLADRLDRRGLDFFHNVIWDKKNPGLGIRYRRQHEMVMVAHSSGAKLAWRDHAKAARNVFSMMPPRNRFHPNEKPVKLVSYFIDLHTALGETILDPFMGSGTTGVAAVMLGRKFIGIELDRQHFDIACRRIEEAYAQPRLDIQEPSRSDYEQESLRFAP
jgi:DNA modification methylase